MTRKPDDFMPLNVRKYLGDTMHLNREQHGAYMLLIMAYWMRGGPLNDSDEELASIVRASRPDWKCLRRVLEPFFIVRDEKWFQKGAEKELARARQFIAAKSENGRKGAQKRWQTDSEGDGKKMAEPSVSHDDSQSLHDATIPLPEHSSSFHSELLSPEPDGSLPLRVEFIRIPTNRFATKGEEVPIFEDQISEFESSFQAVDVRQELREMRSWSIAKPERRKTARGMMSFVNGWLSRQQDKGKSNGNGQGRERKRSGHDTHFAATASLIRELGGAQEEGDDHGSIGQTSRPLLPP